MMNQFKAFKVLPLAMTIALGLQLSSLSALAFSDTTNYWAKADIEELSDNKIIDGYTDGTFRPEKPMTRAEFATILVKVLKIPVTRDAKAAHFSDVPNGYWAAPAIAAVKSKGLINGFPGNRFMPNRNITRLEVMTILSNMDKTEIPAEFSVADILSTYEDGSDVPNWAQESVAEAAYTKVMANAPSRENRIDPNRDATRAEVAAMVVNTKENLVSYFESLSEPVAQPVSENTGKVTVVTTQALVIPDNTEFTITMVTPVSTTESKVGDKVEATLDKSLLNSENQVLLPSNAKLTGTVAMVEGVDKKGKNGRISVKFNELTMPNGERLPIQASLATEDGALNGGTTQGRFVKISTEKEGTVTSVQTTSTALEIGSEVKVQCGDQLEVKLTEPLTLTKKQLSSIR